VISKSGKDTQQTTGTAIPLPPSTSPARSRHSLKKNGLYKVRYRFLIALGDCCGWVGNDGERRMGWMIGYPFGWAFIDFLARRSSPAVSFQLPRFARGGTSGSSLLTTRICWTDFTARAVSSDTSGPSETPAPTFPSFKSKESAQKKRLNSTLERFDILHRIS